VAVEPTNGEQSMAGPKTGSEPVPSLWRPLISIVVFALPVWLNTMYLKRDGFAWINIILVIGGALLVGMFLQDLFDSLRKRSAARQLPG
jgi:hypothetical protein